MNSNKELISKTIPKLQEIKKDKQKILSLVQKDRMILCSNILALQELIKKDNSNDSNGTDKG